MGIIYCHRNLVNGKCYIGQTSKDLATRVGGSPSRAYSNNKDFALDIKEYGWQNFESRVLEEVDNDHLTERETYWIEYFHTYSNGYNATVGGDGQTLYDYDFIAQLLREGRKYQEVADVVGCCLSTVAFVNKKYRIGYVPENHWTERSIPVEQYDLDGHYIQSFNSCGDATRWLFENKYTSSASTSAHTHIMEVARGKRKTAYGFIWKKKPLL